MDKPSLWSRLTRSQATRAVLLYLGAAWILLQVTETLSGLLTLPAWVGPGAVGLVLAGLIVVVATAWVQALPETTAAEEAGEVPSDWEVAPQDALASLRSGALPHLNWARALLGGAVAFSLLFGAAGVYVLLRTPASPFGPVVSSGGPAADGIAVLPFRVTGPELELYREGMVDLVAANLDGLSDYRAIDARTVLARWHQEVGATTDSDLSTALQVAAGTGARFAVVGSGVGIGPQVRFTADLYDLSDGTRVGPGAQAEGTPDAILALVDALTVDVARSLLGDAEGEARAVRPAAMLTPSVEALRHYLRGDAAYRRGRWDEARESLELAIREDSTFALAYWRLGETLGWSLDPTAAQGPFATALSHAERLPPRERTLLTLASAVAHFRLNTELDPLFEYVARYPDDPDGWYFLGEAGLHVIGGTGITDAMLEEALYRAVELAPTFLPYHLHALQWAAAKGQGERFEALLAQATEQGFTQEALGHPGLQWDLLHGDETQRETAAARVAALPLPDVARWVPGLVPLVNQQLDRLAPLDPVVAALNPGPVSPQQERWLWEGRFNEYRASFASDTTLWAASSWPR